MSALYDLRERFVRLLREETPDGLGGREVVWREGEPFDAVLARRAAGTDDGGQRAAPAETYALLAPATVRLGYHEAFRRASDGRVFRAAAATVTAPNRFPFSLGLTECEGWELP